MCRALTTIEIFVGGLYSALFVGEKNAFKQTTEKMKSRSEIFNLLISNEPVAVEMYMPYNRSLKILLEDYYCTNGILVKYLGGYGTVFYIPERDLHEECMRDYTGDGVLYNEDDYSDFESSWMAYVGELPKPLEIN